MEINPLNRDANGRITHARLLERLAYDPETGVFVWLACPEAGEEFNAKFPGRAAGSLRDDGHLTIRVDGRRYGANRLAWFYVTGEWPPDDIEVDHRNRKPFDNRFGNLRLATREQNNANRRARSDSKSGRKGVSFDEAKGMWIAEMIVDGKRTKIGEYPTFEAAVWARQFRDVQEHGEFAYINRDMFGDIGATVNAG